MDPVVTYKRDEKLLLVYTHTLVQFQVCSGRIIPQLNLYKLQWHTLVTAEKPKQKKMSSMQIK